MDVATRCLGALTFALAAALPPPAMAQEVRVDTLVRIVAVVGDSIVTSGEIRQALAFWETSSGQPLPPPGPQLDEIVDQILEERINALLLVQAARRDTTMRVEESEVRAAVDEQVDAVQRRFANRADFEQALLQQNLTIQEYRETLASQVRHERLTQQYLARVFRDRKPPPVTDGEIRAFFEEQAAASGQGPPVLPPSITFDHIVIPVTPSDSALGAALAKADSILALIRVDKQDFALLARRVSEDPGSRDLGGDLGWFRPDQMYAAFERAAFMLRPGDISEPVLTPLGYHLIKLEKVRGPERQARHILIRPVKTPEDSERARRLAEDVAGRLRDGAAFDSLRRAYGDRDEPPRVGPVRRDSMPAGYGDALADASVGTVAGPIPVDVDGPTPGWAVARVVRLEGARPATVDDYRAQIQQQLARAKLLEEVLADLRRSTYVELRRLPGSSGR